MKIPLADFSMSFDMSEKMDTSVDVLKSNELSCYECLKCDKNHKLGNASKTRTNCRSCFVSIF